MCGIAGFWNFAANEEQGAMRAQVEAMCEAVRSRGPDSGGVLMDPSVGLAMGHRRLAIRDLSPAGHQPMRTADGRFSISYNGEIYQTGELRQRLEDMGAVYRGSSDTEDVLQACAHLGIAAALREMSGMFAFALYDHQERRLYLARDRFGVKPLYWGRFGSRFMFGSELGALYALPGWPRQLSRDAVAEFLAWGYINAPLSIWEGVFKLRPGHWLEVNARGDVRDYIYWDSVAEARDTLREPLGGAEGEILQGLEQRLSEAVRARVVSDVPVGAFLSGGVDSSLVTALMQKCSSQPVRTYSIGFEEQRYNEAAYAKAVAEHLGTIHTEAYLSDREAIELIPGLPQMYGEPFADSSQLPTFLLCRLARREVTVALSGDGGDEIFTGYSRYPSFMRIWRERFQKHHMRNRLVRLLGRRFSRPALDALARLIPRRWRPANFGARVKHKAALMELASWQFYQRFILGYWTGGLPLSWEHKGSTEVERLNLLGLSLAQQGRLMDTCSYLPGDILVKVDRASMAVSLEVRPPLLDHRLFSFAWRMPESLHICQGVGKYALREILYRYVPRELVDRPKMGFGVPIDVWLRGPLRDWAESLLNPAKLKAEGWFDPGAVQNIWRQHLRGRDWQYWLWPVLMFQAWQEWIPKMQQRGIGESLPSEVIIAA